ncbi:MAG TPA: TetR/AcrR family transcriptional regulator [Stackebrandtia sp.]|jgi:AcrR family transcriptional regulator|uniref:TetR/AcrR family transcriptional regulator n=1 Tax=Stackebrandtia sp. TaxID=2023065 RepID=UPI002D60C222|nr:TetR/AcrR family transcriptional regulator [Stackebrandtia sp.]HZE37781.1 TetR/AcrR family transcriptional regulator [Stackebrandtia sp.]
MSGRQGRARDAGIDDRVLAVAARSLASNGYIAMSLATIAEEAGTTRQALYRRWPRKADLAAAVIKTLEEREPHGAELADPYSALVAELADYQRGVSQPGRLSLVGTMLQDTTDPDVRARYRATVVAPRRGRLSDILETARRLGHIDADADLEIALTMCTGCWYGRELAGDPAPERWPERTATLIWRALGGRTPD